MSTPHGEADKDKSSKEICSGKGFKLVLTCRLYFISLSMLYSFYFSPIYKDLTIMHV